MTKVKEVEKSILSLCVLVNGEVLPGKVFSAIKSIVM